MNRQCGLLRWLALLASAQWAWGACRAPLRPEAPRAASYQTAPAAGAMLGDGAACALALQAAGRDAGLSLQGDGRLALLAQRFASAPGASPQQLAAAARELGLVDSAPVLRTVVAKPELLAAALVAELGPVLRQIHPTHFGAFVHEDGGALSIVLSYRPIELSPVPRIVSRGATLHLRGRLLGRFAHAKLVVTGPAEDLSFPLGEGPDFDLHVELHGAGAYRLQVLDSSRPVALAELLIYAGAEPPVASPATPPANVARATQIAAALLGDIDALRREQGLAALVVDSRLAASAAHHAALLAAGGAQDVAQGSFASGLVFVRAVRAANRDALFSALSHDASHRSVLLNADLTHVGVAVVTLPVGFQAVIALAALAAPLDTTLAAARLLAALNEHRLARGASALRPDTDLSRAAREAAEFARAQSSVDEHVIVQRADTALARYALAYRKVAALTALVHEPNEASALEPALDPSASAVGIAVVGLDRLDEAAPSVLVILALGWPR